MLVEPMRDRRAERHSETRQDILDAAWAMVRAEGLAGLSLRDLAHRVGMRAPSLYSYFASKNAIFDAMFAQGARAYLEGQAAVSVTGDPLRDLQAGMRFFFDFATQDPSRYQLLFQRTVPGFEPSAESFALSVEGLEAMRERLHSIGVTAPRALDLLTAIDTGLTAQQLSNDPGGDRWSRLVDEAAEMFIAYQARQHSLPQASPRRRSTS